MRLPIALLITGMSLAPFAPAVTDDFGIFRISGDPLAMRFGAPPALALRPAAHALLRMESGGFERLGTKTAATMRQTDVPPNRPRTDPLRKSNIETAIEWRTASPPVGCRDAASRQRVAARSVLSMLRGTGTLVPAYRADIGSVSTRPLTISTKSIFLACRKAAQKANISKAGPRETGDHCPVSPRR